MGQGLGRCCRSGSGWVCDFGFNVVLLMWFLHRDGLRQVGVGCTPTVSWLVAGEGGGEALCPQCVFRFMCWGHSLCFWFVNLGLFGSFCSISGDVVEA